MATFSYEIGETTGTCRAADADGAFRKILDRHYGRSYGWHPEGPIDRKPDIYGKIWYRGYATKWMPKANAHAIESPLLVIKIKATA